VSMRKVPSLRLPTPERHQLPSAALTVAYGAGVISFGLLLGDGIAGRVRASSRR
jgi:hypothetical protein